MIDQYAFEYGRLAAAVDMFLSGETGADRLRVALDESRERLSQADDARPLR